MKLGLREARSAGVFDAPSCALHRRSEINGQEGSGPLLAQAGAAARPKSRPRPRLRPGRGGESATRLGRGQLGQESSRARPSRPWAALWLRAAGPRVCWLGRNGLMNRNSSCFLFIFPEIYIFDEFQLEVDANLCAIFVQRQFCSENSAIFKSFWKNNYGHI